MDTKTKKKDIKREQTVFEQLSKEMVVFAQNNYRNYHELQQFFLYELKLRCISKRDLKKLMIKMTEEKDDE